MRGGRILSILRRDGREEKEKAFWHGWDFLNAWHKVVDEKLLLDAKHRFLIQSQLVRYIVTLASAGDIYLTN